MKLNKNYILLMAIAFVVAGVFTSCSEDELPNGGKPYISYVRVTNPASSDSLLVAGYLGGMVAIIGENLQGTRQVWFDDRRGSLSPNMITSTSVISVIPNLPPIEISNQLTLVFENGDTLQHDFSIEISAPEVSSMKNEYAPVGSTTSIRGDFFFEPIEVTFAGGAKAEVVNVTQHEVEFIVPEGAEAGTVKVKTNFGSDVSSFRYLDQRNIIVNYDDLTASGSWRPGIIGDDPEQGIDGNYLILKGKLNTNQKTEDYTGGGFVSQYWGHTQRPQSNLVEGDPRNFSFKFEAKVVEWYGSHLNITFGPWDNAGNQEYWGNLNARALWAPWEATGDVYTTGGGWITVTIPLTEFNYNSAYEQMDLDPDVTGSFAFWMVGSSEAAADGSPVEVYIDNVRIVPN